MRLVDIREESKTEGYQFDDSGDYVYMKDGILSYAKDGSLPHSHAILVGHEEDFSNFIKACEAAYKNNWNINE